MLLALVVTLVLVLVAAVYVRWRAVRGYWAARGVPHDAPHPLLGSLTFLTRQNPGMWMVDQYRKFDGAPYVGVWWFWRPALLVNDPALGRRVLIKDADVFRDRFLSAGSTDPIGSLNLFTGKDPVWSHMRRKLSPVFTTAKLKVYTQLMSVKAKDLCTRIQKEMDKGGKFNLKDICIDYSTDIVGSASFGVQSAAALTGDSPMRRVTRDFQTYSFFRGLSHTCIFFFPAMVDVCRSLFLPLSFFPKGSDVYLRKFWKAVVEQRGGYETPVGETKDLVDALIKAKQDGDKDHEELPDDVIVAQAAVMVQGGFETSASTMTYALYELAHVPEVQEKLYQELKDIKEKLNGGDFNMDVLADAVYLNAIIKETLRKYPPMGWLDRVTSREYPLTPSLTLPAGTPVYVNAIAFQRDPRYFPEPERFDPDRFLPDREKEIDQATYMPFGEGPRNCIGRRFAQQTVRFGLATLLHRFRLRPLPAHIAPDEVQFEKNALFLIPGSVLHVDFLPRDQGN